MMLIGSLPFAGIILMFVLLSLYRILRLVKYVGSVFAPSHTIKTKSYGSRIGPRRA
jgi:hypothetical protein